MTIHRQEPVFLPTPILSLRPTQITLGMAEVRLKRAEWKKTAPEDMSGFLDAHLVPTILGPGGRHFLIDHHHLARALYEEGVRRVFATVVADLSRLPPDHFWSMMDFHGWTHPYDSQGQRRGYADLPETVEGMEDDPYRSLAGALRNIGGFAKDSTPFAEFLWADFLRPRIEAEAIGADFDAAVKAAFALSKTGDADYLPGWCGPHRYEPPPAADSGGKEGNGKAKARPGRP